MMTVGYCYVCGEDAILYKNPHGRLVCGPCAAHYARPPEV